MTATTADIKTTLKYIVSSLTKHGKLALDATATTTTTSTTNKHRPPPPVNVAISVLPSSFFTQADEAKTLHYIDIRGANHLVQYHSGVQTPRFQLVCAVQKGDLIFREIPFASSFVDANLFRHYDPSSTVVAAAVADTVPTVPAAPTPPKRMRHSEDEHAQCFTSLLAHVIKQGMTHDSLKLSMNFTEHAVLSASEEARIMTEFEKLKEHHHHQKTNAKHIKRLMALVRYYCYSVYGYYRHSIVAMHLYRYASLLKHVYTSDANVGIFFNEDGVVHVYAERDLKVGDCLRPCFYGHYSAAPPLFASWNLAPPVTCQRYLSARDKPRKSNVGSTAVNVAVLATVFENKSHRLVCRMIEHVNASCCVVLNQTDATFHQLLVDIIKHIRASLASHNNSDDSGKKQHPHPPHAPVSKQYAEMFLEYLCHMFWIFDLERIYSLTDLTTIEKLFVQVFALQHQQQQQHTDAATTADEQSVSSKIRITLLYDTWFLIKRQLGMTAQHPEFVDAYYASSTYCIFNDVNRTLLQCDSFKRVTLYNEYATSF